MNIENLQALIAQGLITDLASIDPTQAYVAVGIYQKGNRQKGSANNTYPQYAIPVSELGGAGNVYTASNGITLVGNDFQLASNLISQFTNDAGYLVPSAITGMVTGSGIENYLTKWDASGTNLIDSAVYETGGNVGIGTTSPVGKLHVIASATNYAVLGDNSPRIFKDTDNYLILNDGNLGVSNLAGSTSARLVSGGVFQVHSSNGAGYLISNNFNDYMFRSYNDSGVNKFIVNHGGYYGNNRFGVGVDPTATVHAKGLNSSNGVNDYTAKFVNSSDAALLHLRNDGFTIINGLTIGKGANQISTNVVFGINALANTTGNNNVAIGELALNANTTGINNSAIGHNALKFNTTGDANIAIGTQALNANTTGGFNTAIGSYSLFNNTTGNRNVAIGAQSMEFNTIGQYNTAIGWYTLRANTSGNRNTALGYNSLELNTTGSYNVAVGYRAASLISTGEFNTAVGYDTMAELTTGNFNTFIGRDTGRGITSGSYNTIIGASVTGLAAGTTQNVILADGNGNIRFHALNNGNVGLGTSTPTSKLQVVGLSTYADNAAAIGAGLTAGAMYIRTGHGLDIVV